MTLSIQDPNNFIVSKVGKLMFNEKIMRDLLGNILKRLQESNLMLDFPQSTVIEAKYEEVVIVNVQH